jgi:hypothetical protein
MRRIGDRDEGSHISKDPGGHTCGGCITADTEPTDHSRASLLSDDRDR